MHTLTHTYNISTEYASLLAHQWCWTCSCKESLWKLSSWSQSTPLVRVCIWSRFGLLSSCSAGERGMWGRPSEWLAILLATSVKGFSSSCQPKFESQVCNQSTDLRNPCWPKSPIPMRKVWQGFPIFCGESNARTVLSGIRGGQSCCRDWNCKIMGGTQRHLRQRVKTF